MSLFRSYKGLKLIDPLGNDSYDPGYVPPLLPSGSSPFTDEYIDWYNNLPPENVWPPTSGSNRPTIGDRIGNHYYRLSLTPVISHIRDKKLELRDNKCEMKAGNNLGGKMNALYRDIAAKHDIANCPNITRGHFKTSLRR